MIGGIVKKERMKMQDNLMNDSEPERKQENRSSFEVKKKLMKNFVVVF